MTSSLQPDPEFRVSKHFRYRAASRKISELAFMAALAFGTRTYQRGEGCTAYVLLRRDCPAAMHPETVRRLAGTVVIVSPQNVLVTTYRQHDCRLKDFRR